MSRKKTVVEHHLKEITSAQTIKVKTRIGLRRVFIVVVLRIWRSPMEAKDLVRRTRKVCPESNASQN